VIILDEDKKIIKFPQKKSSLDNEDVGCFNPESWEYETELYNSENWDELINYRKNCCKENPNDPNILWRLGEAYILNNEYDKAFKYLKKLYKKYPYHEDIQYSILDCLFALGKDENDFEWEEKPNVLRMSKEVIDKCYDYLKYKRKPRTVWELYEKFIIRNYVIFNEKDLLKEFNEDSRFEITGDPTDIFLAKIKRKK
jgi:tetratricopeptide (TPR) repeat protein